jgi:hypothetical protein
MGRGTKTGAPSISVNLSMTNFMPRFQPRTASLGNASSPMPNHSAPGSSRSSLTRTGAPAYPSCPMNARPRLLDAPGLQLSWEEILGER